MALREKTNEELFRLYQDDLALRLHNVKNLKDTQTLLRHFMEFLGQFPPSPELAKGFLARYASYNPYTLARYAQSVKAFMQWYGEPLTDVHIKIPKSLPAYTEDVDIEKLLEAIGDKKSHKRLILRDKLLVELALKTGLRRAELAHLAPEDIHENALIVRQGKGQKDRMIPLTADMAKRLHSFVKEHKPNQSVFGLGAPWISMKVKQFARKAGLTRMHTHALRHKFAQDLLESGVDIKAVQTLLGHQNLNTTEVYLSLTDARLYDAIKKMDQHKNAGIPPQEAQASAGVIEVQAASLARPEGYNPSLEAPNSYVELAHQQQIRESAQNLLSQIQFPFIGDRIKAVTRESPREQLKRERFAGSALLEGLRSHLQTEGYAQVLQDIEDFDHEDSDNWLRCQRLLDLVKTEIEQKHNVNIPLIENEGPGFAISFAQTVCADAIERARGSNHYRGFSYRYEGFNLKFGAYLIYAGIPEEDLKPKEVLHRAMREGFSGRTQTQVIADQITRMGEIQEAIRQRLERFSLMVRLPGACLLCDRP